MAAILKFLITYAIVRAVVALGFGVVTFAAVTAALYKAINEARAAYNSLPTDLLQFLAIAEVPTALGIVLGAAVAAASLRFAKRIAFIGG